MKLRTAALAALLAILAVVALRHRESDRAHDWQPIPEMPLLERCAKCGWGWKLGEDNDFPCPGEGALAGKRHLFTCAWCRDAGDFGADWPTRDGWLLHHRREHPDLPLEPPMDLQPSDPYPASLLPTPPPPDPGLYDRNEASPAALRRIADSVRRRR